MVYRGSVKDGVVVLEGSPPLRDGTKVNVELIEEPRTGPRPGSAEAILGNPARWQGDPEEVDRLLAELKEMKRAEVQAQLEEWAKEKNEDPLGDR
ncbi:MAG: hypothetical protein WBD40_16330 [Tepidisphaeraceae bacterium]